MLNFKSGAFVPLFFYMLKYIYICFIIILGFNAKSQNLVVNGSFESFAGANCGGLGFSLNNWNSINSPDYYHVNCNPVNYGVPINRFGSIYPLYGNAYAGIVCFSKSLEVKEYIFQHLNVALITGKPYYVSFFISRADRISYAIKTVGAYFSVSQPSVASSNTWIPANPQVENQNGYLVDTIGWTKIEGYFTAQGGEEYITIGNFNSNANSDTLNTGTTNPIPFDNGTAYYYIDSVSLYDSLDYVSNIKDQSYLNEVVGVYPNPATTILKINYNSNNKTGLQIKINDVLGREVKQLEYDASTTSTGSVTSAIEKEIDISDLEKGIYFLSLYQNEKLLVTKKMIKQ